MNDMAVTHNTIPSMAMSESELMDVLRSSIYPGASDASIKLAINYCKAGGLDVLQKPVHLVPMSVKSGKKDSEGDDIYETRDVVMPGIGLYRINAARTGVYAGMDEPVFGPIKKLSYKKKVTEWVNSPNGKRIKKDSWDDAVLEYPEWCKVVVYRLVDGVRCAFPAIEFWKENYATASRWTEAPNSMWERRVHGQIVKCTEAQALRKACPEIGSQPTAEEMEGKYVDEIDITPSPTEKQNEFLPQKKAVAETTTEKPAAEKPKGQTIEGEATKDTSPLATEGLIGVVKNKMEKASLSTADLSAKFGIDKLDGITADMANTIVQWTRNPAA